MKVELTDNELDQILVALEIVLNDWGMVDKSALEEEEVAIETAYYEEVDELYKKLSKLQVI